MRCARDLSEPTRYFRDLDSGVSHFPPKLEQTTEPDGKHFTVYVPVNRFNYWYEYIQNFYSTDFFFLLGHPGVHSYLGVGGGLYSCHAWP